MLHHLSKLPFSMCDQAMGATRHAAAEYGAAVSRSDIECFIKLDEVERCVAAQASQARPPLSGCRYRAFVDPSGGSTTA